MILICFSMRGVKTQPGHTALLVMPFFAYYSAMALLNPTTPCFADT